MNGNRVLIVGSDATIFDPNSSARARLHSYAQHLECLHVLSRAPLGTKRVNEANLVLHPVYAGKLQAFFLLPALIRKIVTQSQIDVVSAQDPFEHGHAALKGIQGTSARLHIQIHTDFLSPWFVRSGVFRSMQIRMPVLNKIRRQLADTVLPQAHGIRVVSERIATSLKERYGAKLAPVAVIPIIVDSVTPAPAALPEHGFHFSLITVGRLEPEKRIEDILMAIGRVAREYPSIGLYVLGEGREGKKLKTLARKLGLKDRVVFMGERLDARALMASAHAYIQASAYEGYSRTLVEAALARVPIITTDVGIVGEIFRGYEEVLAAPPGDPAALAVHIKGLIHDQQARTRLIMAAQHTAQEHVKVYADQPRMVAENLRAAVLV